ncbi:MAG: AI-2E family transporter [Micavibrio sp.]|nr:AI-2E family transporter [Micavibrio sp.]
MINVNLKDRIQIYQLVVGLTVVTLILIGCLVILTPFFPAMLLATIFTLATWKAFEFIQARLHHKTAIASGLMTLLLAGCFIAPIFIIGTSIAENYAVIYDRIIGFIQTDGDQTAAKLQAVPWVGDWLVKGWGMLSGDKQHLTELMRQYAQPTSGFLLTLATTILHGLLDISLGVIISYFFFRHGTHVAVRIRALIDKFGGHHGQHLLKVSKNTLTGVVYGILGTALLQGVVAALGFWIAGVPGGTFLGLLTFFFSLIPMGPPLIWGPAALWLYSEGQTGWAIFLAIWGMLVVGSIDNFMKPYFISRGSDLPLLLVLLGIMGGALAFGFIGIFIGPTLLALAYTMILEWSTTRSKAGEQFTISSQG